MPAKQGEHHKRTHNGLCMFHRVPLSPHLTEEDRRAVDNVAIVVEFLVGSRTDSSETMQQVAPLLPEVAAQMLPGIISRLTSRIAARTLRELYMLPS